MTVMPGQTWRLWVYDYAYRETIHVESVAGGFARGRTADGEPCIVGLGRLAREGQRVAAE